MFVFALHELASLVDPSNVDGAVIRHMCDASGRGCFLAALANPLLPGTSGPSAEAFKGNWNEKKLGAHGLMLAGKFGEVESYHYFTVLDKLLQLRIVRRRSGDVDVSTAGAETTHVWQHRLTTEYAYTKQRPSAEDDSMQLHVTTSTYDRCQLHQSHDGKRPRMRHVVRLARLAGGQRVDTSPSSATEVRADEI